jgi:hypothetical protein
MDLQVTLSGLIRAFASNRLTLPMTEAEWGFVMTRIEIVARNFDSAYRDMVMGAFRGPSPQLRFQPPALSFDTQTFEIDAGAPMDVSSPAFGEAEPVIAAVREKGKAKAIEPEKEKRERKESNKIWEMRIFDANLHDELQPRVSGDFASREFLINPCHSASAARSASSFASSRNRSSCRRLVRTRAIKRAAIAADISDRSVRCPRISFRRRSRWVQRSRRNRRRRHRVTRNVRRDRSERRRPFLRNRR